MSSFVDDVSSRAQQAGERAAKVAQRLSKATPAAPSYAEALPYVADHTGIVLDLLEKGAGGKIAVRAFLLTARAKISTQRAPTAAAMTEAVNLLESALQMFLGSVLFEPGGKEAQFVRDTYELIRNLRRCVAIEGVRP